VIAVAGSRPGPVTAAAVGKAVRHVLRLDDDLTPFYEAASGDPELAWVARGAGRMIRSQTVFEEVVKTICTTNCSWSATERMVGALVERLGERAPGSPAAGPWGRAFPTPEAMAQTEPAFYRDVARAGYRGPYLISVSRSVADGTVDLEELARASPREIPDEEVSSRLQALPGVGPYAAAHVMMLLGRYSPLILDSWTRPKFARLTGRRTVSDATIIRRFRRFGPYAGLAFWMFLTRDWVDEPDSAATP
jgi:N-glycosylase/DNA lyase